MSLLSTAELRDLVQTNLSDTQLQRIIDREENALVRKLGAHGDGVTAVTEQVVGRGAHLFLRRPAVSITSVTDMSLIASTDYTLSVDLGSIYRLSGEWGRAVTVVYVPVDDRDERKAVLIELCRLAIERTAMKSESVAGEYSYQAPDWEALRARLYRQLMYFEV